MYCKNCGKNLNDNGDFCNSCGKKMDIVNNKKNNETSNEISNIYNAKLIKNNNNIYIYRKINVICKMLLIFNFLLIVAQLLNGELFIIFPSAMLLATTIGILKTEQKKNNIFLMLSIISISLTIFLPIVIMFGSVFVIAFIKLLGGFKDVSILDIIIKIPQLILNIKGGISTLVTLIIIGISFMIIHKKQK